ncbi:MAG: hypothetical protein ACP5G1_01455 [Nanopusillaceae archaeon]
MNKKILYLLLIFFGVFTITYILLKNLYVEKMESSSNKFYTNPFDYTIINFSNNTLSINVTDISLPQIYTNQLVFNISNNFYKLNCKDDIIYPGNSTICYIFNINQNNLSITQLQYNYSGILYVKTKINLP